MLEEEGEDPCVQGYQDHPEGAGRRGLWREVQRHARRRGGGWCTGSYQALRGAGRRGLWREVQRHARRRGGGWCTGVPGFL